MNKKNRIFFLSVCKNILMDNHHDKASITFIFSNDDKLRNLKKKYFNEDVFTDTISFNLEEESDPIEGEVYISLERVYENAITFKQDFITECKRVIIHGCLHLLGYNDESSRDKRLLRRRRWYSPIYAQQLSALRD